MLTKGNVVQQVNYLAHRTEKMHTKRLSDGLVNDKLDNLQKRTEEVKALLTPMLSSAILQHFWVVSYSNHSLSIMVNTVTARNHIRFMNQGIISLLKQSETWQYLTELTVNVVHMPKMVR